MEMKDLRSVCSNKALSADNSLDFKSEAFRTVLIHLQLLLFKVYYQIIKKLSLPVNLTIYIYLNIFVIRHLSFETLVTLAFRRSGKTTGVEFPMTAY